MTAHPGTRLVQLGLKSLGADLANIDGWYGPVTEAATMKVLSRHIPKGAPWAFDVLQRGLLDLGWYQGPLSAAWNDATRAALTAYLTAGGLARASAAMERQAVVKLIPQFQPVGHNREIRQGSARYLVDTFYMHTTATPGNWWQGKTNREMFAEVKAWHVNPVKQGGKGWNDIGYHGLIFPDGECIAGRALTTVGAQVYGHNAGSVGFSMVPIKTITQMGKPSDFYTDATLKTMKQQIARIASQTPLKNLRGHNEDSAKLCPGFIVVDRDWTDLAVA
jgi:N-acetylmuramoyl-L-alanine amidase